MKIWSRPLGFNGAALFRARKPKADKEHFEHLDRAFGCRPGRQSVGAVLDSEIVDFEAHLVPQQHRLWPQLARAFAFRLAGKPARASNARIWASEPTERESARQ